MLTAPFYAKNMCAAHALANSRLYEPYARKGLVLVVGSLGFRRSRVLAANAQVRGLSLSCTGESVVETSFLGCACVLALRPNKLLPVVPRCATEPR